MRRRRGINSYGKDSRIIIIIFLIILCTMQICLQTDTIVSEKLINNHQ